MTGKLAVLVPVFNGGVLLEESIRSCAGSGLDPQRYEILVVDNCSTDGAVDRLSTTNPDGVPIGVYRNSRNLGRIGNWNRAVEIAETKGFSWATFLFVGDVWLPGGSLPRILALLDNHQADFALTSYQIVDSRSDCRLFSPRVSIPGKELLIGSRTLIGKLLDRGGIPICPLQCNVYSLKSPGLLRFLESDPILTDSISTVEFLHHTNGKTMIVAEPFMAWRLHPGRFHASRDILEFSSGDLRLLQETQSLTGAEVNWNRAKAHALIGLLQTAVRFEPWYRWPALLVKGMRLFSSRPGSVSPWAVCWIAFRKLFFHESPMHIDAC